MKDLQGLKILVKATIVMFFPSSSSSKMLPMPMYKEGGTLPVLVISLGEKGG